MKKRRTSFCLMKGRKETRKLYCAAPQVFQQRRICGELSPRAVKGRLIDFPRAIPLAQNNGDLVATWSFDATFGRLVI